MALTAFFYLYVGLTGTITNRRSQNNKIFEFKCTSDLKLSSGTGSSASYCTALTGVLYALLNINNNINKFNNSDLNIINKWSTFGEQIMHGGASSGVDTAICTFGSVVKFRKGDPIEPIHLHPNVLRIMLVDTIVPRDTKKMVAKVAERHKKYPNVINNILNAMDSVAVEALECIQQISSDSLKNDNDDIDKYYDHLKELVRINQTLLCSLDVSHSTLDDICKVATKYNLGGKLTGAGGGGYATILLPPTLSKDMELNLIDELTRMNFNVLSTFIGCAGVQIDKINKI